MLLDEPTTGLDPRSKRDVQGFVREVQQLHDATILLTTHDMDEAERCDRVAVLDHGRLVALGTPDALKAEVGGDVLVVQTAVPEALRDRVRGRFGIDGQLVDGTLRLERARGHELVRDLIEAFPSEIRSVTFGKPTLEDVFVRLTGHRLAES
jgi:ABC-2 type transport system ATP-binding protein